MSDHAPGYDLQTTREEVVVLRNRVEAAEREIGQLREVKHDHANKLQGLLLTVRQIQSDLALLHALPAEIESLKQKVVELRVELETRLAVMKSDFAAQVGALTAAVVANKDALAERIAKLEKRLGVATLVLVVVVEALPLVLRHLGGS